MLLFSQESSTHACIVGDSCLGRFVTIEPQEDILEKVVPSMVTCPPYLSNSTSELKSKSIFLKEQS